MLPVTAAAIAAPPPVDSRLQPCGNAYYLPTQYTCYDTDFLCPVLNGVPTLQCGPDCYNPSTYRCSNGRLVYQPPATFASTASASSTLASAPSSSAAATCTGVPTTQYLSDPPYNNYFYSDCHSESQVVVTSPQPDSNLTIIGSRLLVAWPAGNSGVVSFFAPSNGINGTLGIELVNSTIGHPLSGVYIPPNSSPLTGNARVGVSTLVNFNSSAILTVPILGSIRTIRDFTEGPSILVPSVQNAINFASTTGGGAVLSRLWFDNVTVTQMSFVPISSNSSVLIHNRTVELSAGIYNFTATFDYPQLTQLPANQVLNAQSQSLVQQYPDQTTSLSFLSYTEKLLAGSWRFLTYFGRDSLISLLLLQPVLSEGQGGAVEAVISAVLERLNRTDGGVCHEETIGDYATYLNLQMNVSSTAPGCTYQMVDTDYYLMPVMQNYFLDSGVGQSRRLAFLTTQSTLNFGNHGLSYAQLALINAEKIMNTSAPFAQPGGQTEANLIHLKPDQLVGEWRDSTYGIGGGRIPYDVNTALVPAALRSIAALSAAGFFPSHPDWTITATTYAQVWEDNTLAFFRVTVPATQAQQLLANYTSSSSGNNFPSHADTITSEIVYHGLSLQGNTNQPLIRVMNSDDCFRHFLLNTTSQTQLTSFLNSTANNILAPFPVGLSTPVGMLIANPAFGGDPVYAANWTNNAYHGTVVWSWPMAMMAAGLQRQLGRCSTTNATSSPSPPAFCTDSIVYGRVRAAYNHLWDLIEANTAELSTEVWSWVYNNNSDAGFVREELGSLPPPPGLSPTESDIRQLWSLTFLAVTRDTTLQ
ncbi:hypothetical protein BAUCODRAFT_62475 [Baudoinia panamericana UAMH 10762]|uniref:Endo-1,3(4)-beta-glucanase 1 carbohydrate binding domain-containing protein n=1 Tax=Baudoinia panamericana (strain UAMH 10762) TaxID=717646 RepID=M2NM99_BAUPA|nr:uncharacterized protein BAUCODRAFT_62475 [Baudoinia panamericana UAMH 10762]EMD00635.1 hypothetical protein BAUCODRAFT_62475 [Baudoinia panamericana UAMH 10762]